jgi:transposase
MLNPLTTQIWFYPVPIDFRKQIDGLVMLVADSLEKKPTSGELFLFRNRSADKLKVLYWEDNGFWLLYKRLEQGRFTFPPVIDSALAITNQQLSWLLSGIGLYAHPVAKPLEIQHFY